MQESAFKKEIERFLAEDIGPGDITSEAVFGSTDMGQAVLVAKETFVAAGFADVAAQVFMVQNPAIKTADPATDGSTVKSGDVLLKVQGPVIDLLKAERVALNLVQRLCGIATLTGRFVEQVDGLGVQIVDTRKTTPGLRSLEKYAVRVGGGHNHRFNLADGVLIKDNHIAACGSITAAVERVRQRVPHLMKVEVEATNLEQVRECLACGVEVIMLDNMEIPAMRKAVALVANRALIEASGGVSLNNVRQVAECGVDFISIGALTHSAPACDISMRFLKPE